MYIEQILQPENNTVGMDKAEKSLDSVNGLTEQVIYTSTK